MLSTKAHKHFYFRTYGFTNDGGGFPAADTAAENLSDAKRQLDTCWTQGRGWIEVICREKKSAKAHLVYEKSETPTRIYKF